MLWTSANTARLERELAVEKYARAQAEREASELRERNGVLERKLDRLIAQVLARDAQIVHPITDPTPAKPSPMARGLAALSTQITEFERHPATAPEATMSTA